MDAFEAFSNGQPDVRPRNRSLYYFLLGYARRRGNVLRFMLPNEVGMHGSSIKERAAYRATLKALAGWGFLVYTLGVNRYKAPLLKIHTWQPSAGESNE
jgi:hypothetical protein